ncbi:MAG: homocysteine biosynthesis protein [Candidatus Omnitrophica bacterium]|nr:homocysteine biosynthesis protein [Candidatus Omnitrophota bacterium]MBU4477919.1 homocysteine biosynthesis protein [Candidatus Omnitrophota bacterium]MCG2703853.1 homocysteine biosynthesis protein [Candidatus Omnitrophota bacterium]
MGKTIKQINAKIKNGKAVVVTKEEMLDIVAKKGLKKAAQHVDVVTTGTFGPMCSSMAVFNIGHSKPKIKIQKAWLNDVECYCGLAAVDMLIGATQISDKDPANSYGCGEFRYGGAHVIEDLVSGKSLRLRAESYGTDCYPLRKLTTLIKLKDLNEAWMINPRNCYQNYNVAVNMSERTISTYMGVLRPYAANAYYCSAGQLSPLLNDPYFRTIGVGTRIFLAGAVGYVISQGTQHTTDVKRTKTGVPESPAGTLAVKGDLKEMSTRWLRAASFRGYGVSLSVGIGVPIPILDEEMAKFVSVKDEEIFANIADYGKDYPEGKSNSLGRVNYKELRSGKIMFNGNAVPTAGLSSYYKASEICAVLKERIKKGGFFLTEPVQSIPTKGSGVNFKTLHMRPIE